MLKSPCKGCEYRIVGCHAQCETYVKHSNGLINQRKARDKSGDILGYVKYGKSFLTRINGEMCTYNMVQIIERYKPKIFIIENPMQSRIWEYLEDVIGFKLPYKNRTYYSNYGYIIQKPTIFASNINLGLRNNKTATKLAFKDIKSNGNGRYNERSNIPNELIFDMIRKCERKLNESRII